MTMSQPDKHASDAMAREILGRLYAQARGDNPDEPISDAGHSVLDGILGMSPSKEHIDAALSAISAPEAQREVDDDVAAEEALSSIFRNRPKQRIGTIRSEPQREGLAGRLAELSAKTDRIIRDWLLEYEADKFDLDLTSLRLLADRINALHAPSQPLPQEGDDEDEQFEKWINELDESVIQAEFGYERGEFSVYPAHWRSMYDEGLTPRQAWQRMMVPSLHLDAAPMPLPQEGGRVPDGWKLVPVDTVPEVMWGGLARQLVMWARFGSPTGKALFRHLSSLAIEPPDWLRTEIRDADYVPPKGTVAVCIYRAMLAAAPQPPLPSGAPDALADWQEIETAPTNELVQAFEPHCQGGFQFVGIKNASGHWHNNLDNTRQFPTHWSRLRPSPAIQAAIAQAEAGTSGTSEPFAWFQTDVNGRPASFVHHPFDAEVLRKQGYKLTPVYRAAPSPEPSRQGVEDVELLKGLEERLGVKGTTAVFKEALRLAKAALAQLQGAGPSERGA